MSHVSPVNLVHFLKADPDPEQNVLDPEHSIVVKITVLSILLTFSVFLSVLPIYHKL
jgi:hypothetical protein